MLRGVQKLFEHDTEVGLGRDSHVGARCVPGTPERGRGIVEAGMSIGRYCDCVGFVGGGGADRNIPDCGAGWFSVGCSRTSRTA